MSMEDHYQRVLDEERMGECVKEIASGKKASHASDEKTPHDPS